MSQDTIRLVKSIDCEGAEAQKSASVSLNGYNNVAAVVVLALMTSTSHTKNIVFVCFGFFYVNFNLEMESVVEKKPPFLFYFPPLMVLILFHT